MAKKTKKEKHTQKRKEMRRRQKARQQALPKILIFNSHQIFGTNV